MNYEKLIKTPMSVLADLVVTTIGCMFLVFFSCLALWATWWFASVSFGLGGIVGLFLWLVYGAIFSENVVKEFNIKIKNAGDVLMWSWYLAPIIFVVVALISAN